MTKKSKLKERRLINLNNFDFMIFTFIAVRLLKVKLWAYTVVFLRLARNSQVGEDTSEECLRLSQVQVLPSVISPKLNLPGLRSSTINFSHLRGIAV